MAYGEDDELPPIDPAIFGEVARALNLTEEITKQYWQSLAALPKISSKDPIMAMAVVMGTISLLVAKVPGELTKVLKSIEEIKSSQRALGTLEHHIRTADATCKEAIKNVRSCKEHMRLAADATEHFWTRLNDKQEAIDRKVASVNLDLSQTPPVTKWFIAIAALQILELVLLLYRLR